MFRRKIPVILVGIYSQDEFVAIGLGMELQGIDVLFDAEHLNRAGFG